MKTAIVAGVLALTFGAAQAWANTANPMDGRFAAMASVGNSFEIASSRLALRHANSPELVAFARMMIADHATAQAVLDAAAIPSGAEAGLMLDPDHQKMLDALSALSEADFDEAYAKDQVAAHEELARTLSDYVATGQDPSLHRYASSTLPIVTLHLRRIRAISGQ